MSFSRAAVFAGIGGQLEMRQIPTPAPVESEVLVRVLGCTLCGSDLHSFEARRSVPVPTILGHEIVGEVVAIGPPSPARERLSESPTVGESLTVGDRITWAIVAACGKCFYCQRDLPQKCLQSVKYGHEALRPGGELRGGLADHCLLAPGTFSTKLPHNLPLEVACPASCATATVAAALERAGDLTGQTVCILGAGLLGLTACAMANSLQAGAVLCVDRDHSRRELALRFGATAAVAPEQLAEQSRALTQGHGVDLLLELTGAPAAMMNAWPCLRIGGKIGWIGAVFPGESLSISMEQVIRRHLTIFGIHNYAPRHLARAVEFLGGNHERFPFQSLVARWLPLEEAAAAFELARDPAAVRIGVFP